MTELDEEKTAFHTPHGVYCYTKMPFGLKNAGATYQRLVDKAFEKQVGQNLEVYIDDLVIKSHTEAELLRDIEETFRIKPCPEKIEAVLQLPYPRTIKEVQSLNGKLAGLNRFLSKSAEKSLPLFKTLKKCIKKRLPLDTRSGAGFQTTKTTHIRTPHVGGTKAKGRAINVLVRLSRSGWHCLDDRKGLNLDAKATKRGDCKNGAMLGEHNITYRPRTSVKGQILEYFLVEKPEEASADTSEKEAPQEPWMLFTDGSSCIDGSGVEYEALLAGLRIAAQMGVRNVQVSVDSKLVANQVLGTYIAKEENMIKYLEKVKTLVSGFASFSISQVPRSHNKKADALSKIASTSFAHLSKQVLVEVLQEKSIQEKEVAAVVEEEGPTWMTPITEYLKDGVLPDDKKEANKLRIKARQYELMDGILYRRSFLRPWLRCVGPLQVDYVIREIHEGSCSMHAGPRSVVAKAMRSGYYWSTMHRDARDMILKCKDCQGIDIAGPFPKGPGKVKFLIVALDYFTKWIEAKVVATISGGQVKKFVWDNIVCRFGLPGEIVSDNSKQFSDNPFKDWCKKLNITQRFASVKHPQSNGLVKRANKSLGEGIKARLGEGNKNWIEEIPHVL
ncbi:reverse transcriptase domain-containing protein [Tanacetum coccineum]|uniref:Reverse transcriptase domain-containing protein n=1 Tax=Tanacetum coccineum TaxID=301880 RepID=A0ABQ5FB13_9ASTR